MDAGLIPSFDLADGGVPLAMLRGLAVAAMFSGFGALVFQWLVFAKVSKKLEDGVRDKVEAALRRLVLFSLGLASLALSGWLVFESGEMAGAQDLSSFMAGIPDVALHTAFGGLVLAQLGLSILAGLMLQWGRKLAAGFAGLAVVLQVGHAHALAMYDGVSFLLAADLGHLLAGSIWLGGLLPLLIVVREVPARQGASACRCFSPMGKICVAAMAATALFQGWALSGGIPGLIGTGYGWTELVKLALFFILTGFAITNRYRLAPALLEGQPARARRRLITSIGIQTGFGLAVVLAAGILTSLPPGMHAQPVWPFAKKFSLITIQEDPDFRGEVIGAVLALAGAVFVLAAGIAVRILRWPSVIAAVIIVWFALPHLDLLLVDAYPTSFYHSPTGFTVTSIDDGAGLYPKNCASCHGPEGRGDGPMAASLPIPPADLTAGHLWGHADGELFWWMTHGIDAPEGGMAMPGFGKTLSKDERWDLIDYIRANNAGLAHKASGTMALPVKAPDFALRCGSARPVSLQSLHGKVVRLVFGNRPVQPANDPGVEIVSVRVGAATKGAECGAQDPAIRKAYAIVAGIDPSAMPGVQFLIDPNGWLRTMQRSGDRPKSLAAKDWADPQALLAAIQQICTTPIAEQDSSHAHHQ